VNRQENPSSWSLEQELADFVNKNITNSYTDSQMSKSVLEQESENLRKTLRVGLHYGDFLREKDTLVTKMVINKDKSLSRIAGKIRDITGPLTKIWQQ